MSCTSRVPFNEITIRVIVCYRAAIRVTGSQRVARGSPIQLVCNATGHPEPPPDVDWFKDGRIILSDAQSGLMVTKKTELSALISVLAVRRSNTADAGEYSCRSSDDDVATIVVHVINGQSLCIYTVSRK